MKKCTRCNISKNESEFYAYSESYLHPWCKKCKCEVDAVRRAENRDVIKERKRTAYANNAEKERDSARERYRKNRLRLPIFRRTQEKQTMPLYLYRCTKKKCQHEQEEIRPIACVYEEKFCEVCGHPMENIIARPARMVRGSGGWSSPASKG